ncbi:unnamed protein product, partial [marine sediment metagenome]
MNFDWQRLLKKKDSEPPPEECSPPAPMVKPLGQRQ